MYFIVVKPIINFTVAGLQTLQKSTEIRRNTQKHPIKDPYQRPPAKPCNGGLLFSKV